MKITDVLEIINTAAPFMLQEAWDNCGLQAGHPEWKVEKVMLALDVSLPLLQAAAETGADLVLTHHPLMIQGEKRIDFSKMPGQAIEIAAKNRIGIISAHTNLDKAVHGLNDYFAQKIGLKQSGVLVPEEQISGDDVAPGFGRTGIFDPAMALEDLAGNIREQLSLDHVRVVGDLSCRIRSAAVCTGSGASLLDAFWASGLDLYITGDIKYHDARLVEENGKALIDVGHFGSEHIAVDLLYEKLQTAASGSLEIIKYKKEKDPFIIV